MLYLPDSPSPFERDSDAIFDPPKHTRTAALFLSFEPRFKPVTTLRCIWHGTCRICNVNSLFDSHSSLFQPPFFPSPQLLHRSRPPQPSPTALQAAGQAIIAGNLVSAGTKKTYTSAWNDFSAVCARWGVPALPASPPTVFAYLTRLGQAAGSFSVLNTASAAISFFHRLSGIAFTACATANQMVRDLLTSFHRQLGATVKNRKEPIQRDDLIAMCDLFSPRASSDPNLLMLLTYISVSYAGALRYNEAARLTPADVHVTADYVKLFLVQRKCDQLREGNVLLLARGSSSACPVALLEQYLPLCSDSSAPLFRRLDGKLYPLASLSPSPLVSADHRSPDQPLSDSQARLAIRTLMKATLGLTDAQLPQFGTHSLRSGCASDLAALRVSDRELKAHGGWRSDTFMRYIKDSLTAKLTTSRKLAL